MGIEAQFSLELPDRSNVTVVGVQWGDEGKGKVVDWLASRHGPVGPFGAVVRFNGGHNAGHTLVHGQRTCKLTLVPSGALCSMLGIIGNGVVIDPFALVAEIDRLNAEGVAVSPATLRVAETAALVLPVHRQLDRLRERRGSRIGTTGRGIGPAYEDKAGRRALRLCDLADPSVLGLLEALVWHNNVLIEALGGRAVDAHAMWGALRGAAARLHPYAERTGDLLIGLQREGHRVIFEGAQSVLLDIDHGTYPFVTSSSCVPGSIAAGAGVGPRAVGAVIGVAKAYQTRVGAGPFPTEAHGAIGQRLRHRGWEYGTNTRRPRRCGWLDAALLRQACRTAAVDRLVLTKLDVLDGLPTIKIGIGYDVGGERVEALPCRAPEQAAAQPIYESLPGWRRPVRGARTLADLPPEALGYARRIEELAGVPVALLSTGPDRSSVVDVGVG